MRLVEERVPLLTRARGPLCWVCYCYGKEFVLSDCRQAKNVSVGDAVIDTVVGRLAYQMRSSEPCCHL